MNKNKVVGVIVRVCLVISIVVWLTSLFGMYMVSKSQYDLMFSHKCSGVGSYLDTGKDSTFCNHCGEKVDSSDVYIHKGVSTCVDCGYMSDDDFCSKCGGDMVGYGWYRLDEVKYPDVHGVGYTFTFEEYCLIDRVTLPMLVLSAMSPVVIWILFCVAVKTKFKGIDSDC